VSDIEWEKKYIDHYCGGSSIITLLNRIGDSEWVKIRTGYDYVMSHSLADLGVIPYENGLWNRTNWLEKMEE